VQSYSIEARVGRWNSAKNQERVFEMNGKHWRTAIAALAIVSVATAAMAADQQKSYPQKTTNTYGQAAGSHSSMNMAPRKETVTLAIYGAGSADAARMLTNTLTTHGIRATVATSQNKPAIVEAPIESNSDLGALGKAVMDTNTPSKAQQPPSLDLVLYGHFDSVMAKKATDALAKIQGVDPHNSSANEAAGELRIRIVGGANVTADQIHRALQQAGVWAQFTQNSSARTGNRPFRQLRQQ
jgi:hypothetical protein